MRILFLCGSLEPGRDGVGDYTRRLAGECIRSGHKTAMIALNERRLRGRSLNGSFGESVGALNAGAQEQDDCGTPVPCWRWPNTVSWRKRGQALIELIQSERPNVVSIQFVPYSFNPKGLPFEFIWMIQRIAAAVKVKWHVMFHELWVGMDIGSRFRHQVIRLLQEFCSDRIHRALTKPKVSVTNRFYHTALALRGIDSFIVPLFSNIEPPAEPKESLRDSSEIVILIFGTLERRELGEELLYHVKQLDRLKRATLNLVGNVGELWQSVAKSSGIAFEKTGFIDDTQISHKFLRGSFGLASSNSYRLGKSGSAIAMIEHGLTVYVGTAGWTPKIAIDPFPLPDGFRSIKSLLSDFHSGSFTQERGASILPRSTKLFLSSIQS